MVNNEYDAIVVGSGISGGWAAKELCERGLKVLMLERGKDVKHIEDYKNDPLVVEFINQCNVEVLKI